MSLFHLSKLQSVTSRIQGLREAFGRRPARRAAARKPRRLMIDPLEERQLLSVSVLDLDDVQVNQQISASQGTVETTEYTSGATQSIAVDNDGDFVVTWTRYDEVLHPVTGEPIIDLETGLEMTDANIYARYFTDEVQRITLPDGVVDDSNPEFGHFSMTYGGNEVQKISITATYEPFAFGQSYIIGSINFGFDVDGSGSVSPGEKVTFVFDESAPLAETEAGLQTALQGIGGALADVTVTARNTHEFFVNFGDLSLGEDQPELIVSGASFVSGFLPAVTVSTVREPIEITAVNFYTGETGIPVFPDNPADTAQAIEYAFLSTMENYFIAPIEFDPQEPLRTGGPESDLLAERQAAPRVSVTAVSATVFDVTFVGESGSQDHPELVIASVFDEFAAPLATTADAVQTLKEPSPEFRVNAEEPDNPVTPWPDFQDQTNAAVAIDADGDFAIAWQSEISAASNPGSVTDVFARRFSPVGAVDAADVSFVSNGELIPGVIPLGGQFQVNSFEVNKQEQPSIGMDDDGNFLIAWSTQGQSIGFFNAIIAQRFNRDGERVGNEYQVNAEDTNVHIDPFVAMSNDGHAIIVWSLIDEEGIITGNTFLTQVYGEVYAPDGTVLLPAQFFVGGGSATAAFDSGNNFVISYEALFDDDATSPPLSLGVRATMYELYDAAGAVSGAEVRPEFRVNNATLGGGDPWWPLAQYNSYAGMDADGDLVFAYEGYGPDVADDTVLYEQWLKQEITPDKNADLLPFMPWFPIWDSGDVDATLDSILIDAFNAGASDEQLGRMRAILDNVMGQFRGEANGIMYTTLDSDPRLGTANILYSDSITNSFRDGRNARYFLAFDGSTGGGNFALNVDGEVTANIAWNANLNTVRQNIENALEALDVTGDAWGNAPWQEGPVSVRYVDSFEINERAGTPWEIRDPWSFTGLPVLATDFVFEVTFQGSAHDMDISMFLENSALTSPGTNEIQLLEFGGDTTAGWFALGIGTQTTVNILFDPANLAAVAANIQAALVTLGFGGTTVTPIAGGPPFRFQVVFGGASGNTDQPPIFQAPSVTSPVFAGWVFSTTLVNGGSGTPPAPVVAQSTEGTRGTAQTAPALAVEPDGDFVIAWTEYAQSTPGIPTHSNVHFRRFDESSDTAGPLVTEFTLPDGERLENGAQMLQPLQTIVVAFDEQMMVNGTYDVKNADNWALLRDGAEVLDGISEIFFGMNEAASLASQYDLNPVGTNKWEAVIVLDGNGTSAGLTPLGDGHYQIVAKNVLRDKMGNPLGRTGYNSSGLTFSRDFEIAGTAGSEMRVNRQTPGGQFLLEPADELAARPGTPRSVAANADGDYVTVWTNNGPNSPSLAPKGVYAKMYEVSFEDGPNGRETYTKEMAAIDPDTGAAWANNEIRVTDDPTATFASIARDADGDFLVTWSQQDWLTQVDPTLGTSWDIYARRYDSAGNPISDAFRVNTETDDIQRFSSVGMDADGDFIIAWQSQGQDGSGYGIYAQRYSPAGNPIGGTNEVQVLTFVGQPTGTFRLGWDGDPSTPNVTGEIQFDGNTFGAVDDIQAALEGIGAEVEVVATNLTDIVIRFIGLQGSGDQPRITVESAAMTGAPGAQVAVATRIDGATGEFQVNDTTENNQRFASVAMGLAGDIIVSWTSSGQDGDAAYETNVYAKQLDRNEIIRGSSNMDTFRADPWQPPVSGAVRKTFIVTTDDPGNHVIPVGAGFDGVGTVNVTTAAGSGFGTGSLLTTGIHILTAAHVVADAAGNPLSPGAVSFTFNLSGGDVTIGASQIFIHPNYNGNPFLGADVAIIALEAPAPGTVERYDIYRNSDELGQVGSKYGYGLSGTGDIGSLLPGGVKRSGENRYEATGGIMGVSDDLLVYDFDNGLPLNDAFGVVFGLPDLGLGDAEVIGAPGDSGGPTFLGGLIASVVTGGISLPGPHDVIAGLQSSFGDFGLDTMVSPFATWIDSVTVGSSAEILINQTIANDQKWSSVAIDSDGDFVVTWTSYGQDGVGSGPGPGIDGLEGVYARRFDFQGSPTGNEFLVNDFAAGEQQHPQVDIDADGDFIIAWESFQERPAPPFSGPDVDPDEPNSFGIYAQRYARETLIGVGPFLGPNGEIGGELHINNTEAGDQRFPSIALNATGDAVLVWSGYGDSIDQSDDQGIFFRRIPKGEDDAGPIVADVVNAVPEQEGDGFVLGQVLEGTVLAPDVAQFMVTFSEEMLIDGPFGTNSLLNLSNWQLTKDGSILPNGVSMVQFGLNQGYLVGLTTAPSNKYVAVITFDVESLEAGNQPLNQGDYVLSISDATQDLFGNALDGNMDGVAGGRFNRKFSVLTGGSDTPGVVEPQPGDDDPVVHENSIGNQDSPAVSTDAQGNFVAVWVDYGQAGDLPNDGSVLFRRFNAVGDPLGASQIVNSYLPGSQKEPDVATDFFGNFVVVWSGEGGIDETGYSDNAGIFARIYDAFGVPQGEQFRVNEYRPDAQITPRVDMGPNGEFVVTWSGAGLDGDGNNIYARKYNLATGQPTTGDVRVNTYTTERQENSDVALDDDGRFAVVWASYGEDGSQWGIYGQNFDDTGQPLGGEYRVNTQTSDKQIDPRIAMDGDGDYVVSWSSFDQDSSGYGVYARRFNLDLGAKDAAEFLVNQETLYWQHQAAVAMDSSGDFVVTWSTLGQDNEDTEDFGVYARLYNANGSDFIDQTTALPVGELRINAMFRGNQVNPAVAMDDDGDFVVAWVGPEDFPDITGTTDVFVRTIGVTESDSAEFKLSQGGGWGGSASWAGGQAGVLNGPATLLLGGVDGQADTFEFTAGDSPGDWTVIVNGQRMVVSPYTVGIYFDGGDQSDTVVFTGSDGADQFNWNEGTAEFSGTGFRVEAHNVENVTVYGGGGMDGAYLSDSHANDQFASAPGTAALTGGGYSVLVDGFAQIGAFARNGGVDNATFTGSAGDETLVADSTAAKMYGDAFKVQAKAFESVLAVGAGGNDQALLADSRADDIFLGQADESRFYSNQIAFDLTVRGFNQVTARSSHGGQDRAELSDTTGNDVFLAEVNVAAMFDLETSGDVYRVETRRFNEVSARADSGGDDLAMLYGVDTPTVWEADYLGGDTWSTMSSETRLLYTALAFDQVEGHGVAGADNTLRKGAAVDFILEFGDWDEIL